jgi:hypothetical protein
MKQYQVPQFITFEDRVVGPLTLKQFAFLGAGAALIFVLHALLVPLLFYPLAGLIGGSAAALAFLKVNQQPLPVIIRHAFLFFIRPRLYLWKKEESKIPPDAVSDPTKKEATVAVIPQMSASKLSDLAWSLDIQGRKQENINQEAHNT